MAVTAADRHQPLRGAMSADRHETEWPNWEPKMIRGRPPSLGNAATLPLRRASRLSPKQRLTLHVAREELLPPARHGDPARGHPPPAHPQSWRSAQAVSSRSRDHSPSWTMTR